MDWWRKKLTTGNDGAPLPYDLINEEAAKRCGAEEGLFFCGENVYRIKEMTTVKELIHEIMDECQKNLL